MMSGGVLWVPSVAGVDVAWEPIARPGSALNVSSTRYQCPTCGTLIAVIAGTGHPWCCGQPMEDRPELSPFATGVDF
jgi:desulfoferrodoxin-like iron-binding protein